jgi:hypothetical protein
MKIDDQTSDNALIMMQLIFQSEDDFRKGRSYTSAEIRAELRRMSTGKKVVAPGGRRRIKGGTPADTSRRTSG